MRTQETTAKWTPDTDEGAREHEATRREYERRHDTGTGRSTLPALVGTIALLAGCAQGEYRMPYENGTVVEVVNDHVTHSTPKAYMYDIKAQNPTPATVVAAAPGWVRFIDDSHEEPTSDNNYVWIEHPYPFCPVDASRATWPGKPANYDATCVPCDRDFCNEWTTYAHMTKNSVRVDAGLSEGDWVEAGDFLGYEDDVGNVLDRRASPLARGGHPTGHGAHLQRLLPGLRRRDRAATGGHPDRVSPGWAERALANRHLHGCWLPCGSAAVEVVPPGDDRSPLARRRGPPAHRDHH